MTVREFHLPDIGEGLVEAEIIRWTIPVGEPVAVDQTLVEVETAKAATEIPSPFAGTVIHHGAAEGDVVAVGAILAVIGDPGDTWPPAGGDATPIVGSLVEDATELAPVAAAPEPAGRGRVAAMPQVRKLAKDLGVDLDQVSGTGPAGRITRTDVEAAARPAPAAPSERGDQHGDERRRMSQLRRTIADNISRSWAEIPHVTAFDEVDASRLLAVRAALGRRHDVAIPIDALVVAAVVPALRAVPVFNSHIDGADLVFHGRHDIGIAVDTPDGLIVAVVRDAGAKNLLELAAAVRDLSERARARTLSRDEVTRQTFTVSNTGAAGGTWGTPIVPPGTTGILAVGRAKDKPVVQDGKIGIAPIMPLSLSYDHRVTDGAVGRRFLAQVVENLTEPALFLTPSVQP
jgi:pyruvate dehydrogenase E2 component (dihydrolipoamide acetyltransferase)